MAESNRAIYTAIAADAGIATAKFVAAGFSGSTSMLVEGVHSFIDGGIAALMLVGVRRSTKPPDAGHPFGYSMELYFWSTVVAVLLFALGGGISGLEGVDRLIRPQSPENPYWNYGVLLIAAAFTSYSFRTAYRQLRQSHPDMGTWQAIRRSKDPRSFSMVLLDTGDAIGVGLAFLGVLFGHVLGSPYPDGIAALLIALELAGIAVFLANECRHLMIGESADPAIVQSICGIVDADPAVATVHPPYTMQLGPEHVLAVLNLRFRGDPSADDTGQVMDRIERAICARHPEVKRVFLELDSFRCTEAARAQPAGRAAHSWAPS